MGVSMSRSFARVLVFGLAATAFLPPALAQTKGNGLPGGQKLLFNLEVIAYDPTTAHRATSPVRTHTASR